MKLLCLYLLYKIVSLPLLKGPVKTVINVAGYKPVWSSGLCAAAVVEDGVPDAQLVAQSRVSSLRIRRRLAHLSVGRARSRLCGGGSQQRRARRRHFRLQQLTLLRPPLHAARPRSVLLCEGTISTFES